MPASAKLGSGFRVIFVAGRFYYRNRNGSETGSNLCCKFSGVFDFIFMGNSDGFFISQKYLHRLGNSSPALRSGCLFADRYRFHLVDRIALVLRYIRKSNTSVMDPRPTSTITFERPTNAAHAGTAKSRKRIKRTAIRDHLPNHSWAVANRMYSSNPEKR